MVETINGVQIGPGATLLTRMPLLHSSCAKPPVKLAIAPLVAAYASNVGLGMSEFTELVLMIDPPAFICGSAALQMRNIAVMLISNVLTHSSSGISSRAS